MNFPSFNWRSSSDASGDSLKRSAVEYKQKNYTNKSAGVFISKVSLHFSKSKMEEARRGVVIDVVDLKKACAH